MEFLLLFLVGAGVFGFIIYIYQAVTRKNINNILERNKNVPPLLLIKSAEQKLVSLKRSLSNLDTLMEIENDTNDPLCYIDSQWNDLSTAKKTIALQLELLVISYRNGQTTLDAYCAQLGALLIKVNALKLDMHVV